MAAAPSREKLKRYSDVLKDKRENVSWKGAYVEECGEAAATALAAAQPMKEVLEIEAPAQ